MDELECVLVFPGSATGACTKHGDMMLLHPTGASEATAKSDKLTGTKKNT